MGSPSWLIELDLLGANRIHCCPGPSSLYRPVVQAKFADNPSVHLPAELLSSPCNPPESCAAVIRRQQ
jgi:hypothetical protein